MLSYLTLLNHARHLRDFIFDLIFPIECLGCGQEGLWLCQNCLEKIKFRSFNYCFACKKTNLFGEFCLTCQPNFNLDGIWIAGDYENKILSELIKKLKYNFIADISEILGNFMSAYLSSVINCQIIQQEKTNNWACAWQSTIRGHPFINKEDTLLIPVPIHKKRKRWRGFNQAELLAKVVANNFNIIINSDCLIKIKNNPPQANLKEAEREKNIINCFAWHGPKLNKQTIILVDDIATTGATLNECAKVLKQNGALEVWGLVAAKG